MESKELLNKIHRNYELLQSVAEQKKKEEIKKAYEKSPSLKEIDEKINNVGFENMRAILSKPENATQLRIEFEKKINELKAKRDEIIEKDGINKNYNKPVYQCSICSDTGYVDSKRCICFEKKIIDENNKNSDLGAMLSNEGFESFSVNYYDHSNKEVINSALNTAKAFVENFDNINYSLLFYGNTGLGKTFLSTITSNELLKKGKSVCYKRATKMFSEYTDYKFNDYSLKSKVDEMYNCDLLVIDDLGTENTNKNDVSFLFDLINDRLINNKKMIINTNLDLSAFSKNYTVRLTSRIYENFRIFKFDGKDIRIQKLQGK